MTRIFLALTLLLGYAGTASAQELYMPRNIKKAYTNQTRNRNGMPGARYWQNKGRYDIQLKVNAPSGVVYGQENIRYINNSPDTLKSLVIRLLCNLHKVNAPRSGYVSRDFLTEGVTIDTFLVNGAEVNFDNDIGTVGAVKLPEPLNAKDSIDLHVSWHYTLSEQSGREGKIDSTTFFLAYAYPRVSVYDDYNGWDVIEHMDRVEFYSDFNDYNVAVTVPKNYVVWGTGVLQNAGEVLQPAIAKRLKDSYTADKVMHVATKEEMSGGQVTQQKDWNTWKFTAADIADVTFGTSNHYVWDAASVVVDSSTGRRSSVQAAYDHSAADFHHSVDFSRYALDWFSRNWPGIPYPFPTMTAFQGFADMEYPMMVNDATVGDELGFAQLVQDHEIAHTYFPFYMGINESRYAFMDEGWATTFEYLIGIAEKGKEAADKFYQLFRVRSYINDPSGEEDQPIISQSHQVSGAGYGNNAYGKPSLAYLALKDLLGDQVFRKSLHAYMNAWHGKHPMPWDFFNIFNTASGQNLNWFWNNWFFSNNYIDLQLADVKTKGNTAELTIINNGGFAIPFDVVITAADGSISKIHQTPAVWKDGNKKITVNVPAAKNLAAVQLDGVIYMDYTPADNKWKK
ncbi:M1 family metallopeptidase [Chitinophaga rhizophila]|uniref:M1 family metallopeptidase n=1 Tax=Chitinophaga rhizophila TaxID=2866212 RepID=A0ABS7GH51_9BACT|nr:M1 family metallopeptidase [Chitinophaga rhizophila]MBW8687019.1 M1 family metallopeptidase [Chitinophaga rhizophila]